MTCYIVFRPTVIVRGILNDPHLVEFRRCKLLKCDYEFHDNKVNFSWWLNPKLEGIDFSYLDTTFQSRIKYYYKVHAVLQNNMIKRISLAKSYVEITPEMTVEKLIQKIEKTPTMTELVRLAGIKECHVEPFIFKYSNSQSQVFCDYGGEIVYFKAIDDIPPHLKAFPAYEDFFAMLAEKGFTASDFDSIIYDKRFRIWRARGFMTECRNDIVEVNGYMVQKGTMTWLSNPDTISPMFLKSKVNKKLLETGLPQNYVKGRFTLLETGATRDADYFKKGDHVIEASRVVGYFLYLWQTGTWLDKYNDGFRIKVYFTHYLDRDYLELVRIGTSYNDFHASISLHPIAKIVTLAQIKGWIPEMDTTKVGYQIDAGGKVWLTCIGGLYRYDVDLETGTINKGRAYGGMSCILPADVHLYSSMEQRLNYRRR